MRIFLTTALCAALAAGASAQDADPASYFADDTTIIAGVRDISKLYGLDEDHPIKELGRHPAVKHVFGETFEGMAPNIDEEFYTDLGMTVEELAKAFPRRLILAGRIDLTAKAKIAADEEGPLEGGTFNFGLNTVNPDVAVVADCTLSEEELEALFEGYLTFMKRRYKQQAEEDPEAPKKSAILIRERDAGQNLFRFEYQVDGKKMGPGAVFTLVEGILVFGQVKDDKGVGDGYLADVIRRVESGGREKDSLGSTDGYLDTVEKLEGTDFYLYAPLEKLAEALEKTIGDSYDEMAEEGNPIGLLATKDGILNTIGLGDFKAFSMAGTVVPEGFVLFNEVLFNERKGIISKILKYDDRGISLPDFAPEGLTAVNASSLDLGGMLTEMLDMVKTISPMASGSLDMQLAMMEKEGFSVRDGLIGSLGVGLESFAGFSSDEVPEDRLPSHLFVLNLSDPDGMERALAGLRAYLAKMGLGEAEKREFMGETIYQMDELTDFLGSMVDLDAEATSSYAVVGNRLLVAAGELDFMEHGITSLKKKGADLDEDPAIEDAWNRWDDKDLVEFAYEDMATFLRSAVLSVSFGTEEFADEGEIDEIVREAVKEAVDAFPPVDDLHYYLSSKTYNTPEALSGWMIIAKKPKP